MKDFEIVQSDKGMKKELHLPVEMIISVYIQSELFLFTG